jgi:hypothetical protein
MISEWMKVMLDEISRKRAETEQGRIEERTRTEERTRVEEQTHAEDHARVEQPRRRDDDSAQG